MRLQLIDQLKALIEVSIHASVKDATAQRLAAEQ